ncbi:MAG TPA: SRPBCC family protein [Gemmatimonadaceae bacterium]
MNNVEKYSPSAETAAKVHKKEGDQWTLVLVRELHHPPAKVWEALTDPEQLREWAPFDSDRNLGSVGTATLSTFGAPYVSETKVKRADAPRALEYDWGGGDIRWELEPVGRGTRLTLWANIDRRYIAMGAAGWHVCLDVMDQLLAGQPIGRIAGPDAMKVDGWKQLTAEYSKQFREET